MVSFITPILKYAAAAEKTGWSYIDIPETIINALHPQNKKSFRVKGRLDDLVIKQIALLPTGNGFYIMPINYTMRKALGKRVNDTIKVELTLDESEFLLDEDFSTCLQDVPLALQYFNEMSPGHRRYFSKWITEAKTIETKTKRIQQSIFGLSHKMDYGTMVRYYKKNKI